MTPVSLFLAIAVNTVLSQPETKQVPQPTQRLEHAIVLFDGENTDAWVRRGDGKPYPWEVEDESMVIRPGGGSIQTNDTYQNFVLYVEFMTPHAKDAARHQSRGNSGVYLQSRYEVQILESWEQEAVHDGCGALYRQRAPDVNASRAPGEWQWYMIDFTAPHFDGDGKKTANARITVHHNGLVIHDDVELVGKTGAGAAEGPEPGPIVLQDHGSKVRFRNIWIVKKEDPGS